MERWSVWEEIYNSSFDEYFLEGNKDGQQLILMNIRFIPARLVQNSRSLFIFEAEDWM